MTIVILPPQQIIHRAVSRKGWIKNGIVSPAAFILRPRDEGKLSVITQANCTALVCSATLSECFGEITLSVSTVNSLSLSAIEDPLPNNPNHAAIIGLPPHEGEILADAEFLAGEIAKGSTINRRQTP